MAGEDSQEKTEQASPQKLRKARERGEVSRSQDLSSAVLLAVATAGIAFTLEDSGRLLRDMAARSFAVAAEPDLGAARLLDTLAAAFADGASSLVRLLVLLALAALLVSFLQVGPLLSLEPIKPKLERLNPLAGAKRLFFELSAYVELAKALLKTLAIGGLAWAVVQSSIGEVLTLAHLDPAQAARRTVGVVGSIAGWIVLAVAALGALDLFYQRWSFAKKMRMSKQEVKDEYRQDEGDPYIKSQRRQAHQELSEGAMIETVRQADVVVTNPTHIACALRYDPGEDDAPRLLGKGRGVLAERIKAVAKEEGIPIVRDVSLARALYELEAEEQIPEALYEGVVEVLKWVEQVARAEGRDVPWRRPGSGDGA